MGDLEIRVKDYSVQPGHYFWRAEGNLDRIKEDARPHWFFYAAFEYRCCMEQLLRYYLELLGVEWSKNLENMYLAKDLKRAILKSEPEFYDKLRFADVLIRALGYKGVYQVDLERISTLYGQIGGYLHAQIRPDETVNNAKWWGRFWTVLQDTREYLYVIQSHELAHVHLEEPGWDLYSSWKAGTMTELDVQREFIRGFLPID